MQYYTLTNIIIDLMFTLHENKIQKTVAKVKPFDEFANICTGLITVGKKGSTLYLTYCVC